MVRVESSHKYQHIERQTNGGEVLASGGWLHREAQIAAEMHSELAFPQEQLEEN